MSDQAWISPDRRAGWAATSLLTPVIPAILVADLILLAQLGVPIPTISEIGLRASPAEMSAAFDFFWLTFAFAFVVSAKLVMPSTLALLLFHLIARLIGWIRWWAYGAVGAAIGAIAGSFWSAVSMGPNAAFCAIFGAAAGLYLWAVLHAPQRLRWTAAALVFTPATIATVGSVASRLIAAVL